MKTEFVLVLSTVPDEEIARSMAAALVEEELAACVSLLPGVESHYRWQGKKEISREFVLMIKSLASLYPQLEARLRRLHPYECPEILALPVEEGSGAYLQWIRDSCLKSA